MSSVGDDPEILELALDQLHSELASHESGLRQTRLDLVSYETRLDRARQQLEYLRVEAKVVLLSEYQSALNLLQAYRERLDEILGSISVVESEIRKTKVAIKNTEAALQKAQTEVSSEPMNTAKILEFPHAQRGRDSFEN